jgi:hypothetical protein
MQSIESYRIQRFSMWLSWQQVPDGGEDGAPSSVPEEFRIVFKKLLKKDSVTKTKVCRGALLTGQATQTLGASR